MEQATYTKANITETMKETALPEHLLCFSHLRWDFVYQRPQHLLSRLGKTFTVLFIEEPMFDATHPHYSFTKKEDNVTVVVPHLPAYLPHSTVITLQQQLLDDFLATNSIEEFAAWYYTPMALPFTRHLKPVTTIFDCMDELSAFKFAPQELKDLEAELLNKADVVFTGGNSLYQAKKDRHHNIHSFPSSIDRAHFGRARKITATPGDQARIASPRLGFFGVIDERFDIALIDEIAKQRPDWHLILIGPVVKIDPAHLPMRDNIHYLGGKSYMELPDYLAGWDVAMIPFAINESTKFISPTKTPEYLAAGIPVVSTPITDVIEPYGNEGLVYIANTPEEFIQHAESILIDRAADAKWLKRVDAFLADNSWDITANNILGQIKKTLNKNS